MFNETLIFSLFSSLGLVSAGMVIRAKNPVHSVLFLILVFCNASGLLLLLGLEFFAMMFLVVYVGAIAVLFLFVVMMLNVSQNAIQENSLRYFPVGGLIGLIFFLEIFLGIANDLLPFLSFPASSVSESLTQDFLRFASWAQTSSQLENLEAIGHILYTDYVVQFMMSSLILLVAMIGAIVLTLQKKDYVKRQEVFDQNRRDFTRTIQLI